MLSRRICTSGLESSPETVMASEAVGRPVLVCDSELSVSVDVNDDPLVVVVSLSVVELSEVSEDDRVSVTSGSERESDWLSESSSMAVEADRRVSCPGCLGLELSAVSDILRDCAVVRRCRSGSSGIPQSHSSFPIL